jgi:hypothetical protein
LRGTVRVTYEGTTVSRSFSLTVRRAPETLTIFDQPNLAPARPQAGRELQAAVKVRWVREGTEHSLVPKATRVVCGASVAGSRLRAVKQEVRTGGVICGWLIPPGASGKTLDIVITVRSQGKVARRTFEMRIR